MTKTIQLLMIFTISILLSNCKKDDGTNGIQLNIFSIEDDKSLGKQVSDEIASNPSEYPIMSETQYATAYAHIRRIRDSILLRGTLKHKDDFTWEVKLIKDDSVLNAFCTPGGYIYVYTGLIKYLDSEDQLAGVMGHEIAHADERHSTESMTNQFGRDLLLKIILGDSSAVKQVANGLLNLNYSRGHETEADLRSVEYLYATAYDARGTARFFEKLVAQGQQSPPQFLSTHPNPENRVANILKKWTDMGGKTGQTFNQRYQDFKNSL